MQSTLIAAGPVAQGVVTLTYLLTIGAVVILIVIVALLVYAMAHRPGPVWTELWVVGGGVVFPVVVLSALLFQSARMTNALTRAAPPGATRIEVEGRQWWWEVRYPDAAGGPVVAANEIHLPIGTAVDLALTSPDVIHSFWVPNLGGKVDMVPGRVNRLTLRADRAGVYRGQCAEYCGTQHAQMALVVVVETPEAFAAWLLAEAATARAPDTPERHAGTRRIPRARLRRLPHHPRHGSARPPGPRPHPPGEPPHPGSRHARQRCRDAARVDRRTVMPSSPAT